MLKIVLLLHIGVLFVRCDNEYSDGIIIEIFENITSGKMNCVTITNNHFQENQGIFVFYKPLQHYTLNPESCYRNNNDTDKFVTPKTYTQMNDVIVQPNMDTTWICPFHYGKFGRVLCQIPVHVRYARSAEILVNDNALKMEFPKYPVTEYDEGSQYEYSDDELVYITCKLLSGTTMKFDVIGFDNKSLILPPGYIYANTLQVRAVLNKNHNLSHVDCIVQKTPYRDAIYRLFLKPKRDAATHSPKKALMNVKATTSSENNQVIEKNRQETRSDDLVIKVNGLVPPMMSKTNAYYNYEKGELVNVTCENFNDSVNLLNILIEDYDYGQIKEVGYNAVTAIVNTSKISKNNELKITCNQLRHYNKDILLKEEVTSKGVVILGLLQRNIIFKYINEISSNVIVYNYKDYEVLDLTWMYGGTDVNTHYRTNFLLTWKDKVIANPDNLIATSTMNITSQTIRLSPHDDNSIVKCIVIIYKLITHEQNVHRFKEVHEFWIVLRRMVGTESEINTGNKDATSNVQMNKLLVPISCAICFVIVIISLGVLYAYCKRLRRSPKEADETNDTNDLTQSSRQFPDSWDNYANAMINTQPSTSSINCKHMYATPIPKKYRQVKDQTVVRDNSLYEPLENDKDSKKNVNRKKDKPDSQNDKRYGNIADYSTANKTQDVELYSEVSLTG